MIHTRGLLLALSFCCANVLVNAQIVNIEALRMQDDSLGFSGQEVFSFSLVQNTQRLLQFSNNLALQYRRPKNVFLFLTDFTFSQSEANNFERNGFAHVRHNYVLTERWSTELFSQYQVNIPLRIEARALQGVGVRWEWLQKKQAKLAVGTSVMYEYDVELRNDKVNEAIRGNLYLSAFFSKTKRYALGTTVYYQPNLSAFVDYRFSGQAQFAFFLWKGLQFTATASANYDAEPVVDSAIPNLTYKITNGLSYSF